MAGAVSLNVEVDPTRAQRRLETRYLDEMATDLDDALKRVEAARKARDFARADAIREELKSKGWTIEDTPKGPKLKRL